MTTTVNPMGGLYVHPSVSASVREHECLWTTPKLDGSGTYFEMVANRPEVAYRLLRQLEDEAHRTRAHTFWQDGRLYSHDPTLVHYNT